MLSFEWNALRVGDHVLVHESADRRSPLLAGVVAMVDRSRGVSDVGVRTTEVDGAVRLRRPVRLATHLDPHDPDDTCWRCAGT